MWLGVGALTSVLMAPGPRPPSPGGGGMSGSGGLPALPYVSPITNRNPFPNTPRPVYGPPQNIFPPPNPAPVAAPVVVPARPNTGQGPAGNGNNCASRTIEWASSSQCSSPSSNSCTGRWSCRPNEILLNGGSVVDQNLDVTSTCDVYGHCLQPTASGGCVPSGMSDSGRAFVSTTPTWTGRGSSCQRTCQAYWRCGSGCLVSPASTTVVCTNNQCVYSAAMLTKPTSCVPAGGMGSSGTSP